MPYNTKTEITVVISKKHHAMLQTIASKHKRTLRAAAEIIIEEAYAAEAES